jgi:hypothetical protein
VSEESADAWTIACKVPDASAGSCGPWTEGVGVAIHGPGLWLCSRRRSITINTPQAPDCTAKRRKREWPALQFQRLRQRKCSALRHSRVISESVADVLRRGIGRDRIERPRLSRDLGIVTPQLCNAMPAVVRHPAGPDKSKRHASLLPPLNRTHFLLRPYSLTRMAVQVKPIPVPVSLNKDAVQGFGAEVTGVDPANLSDAEFKE